MTPRIVLGAILAAVLMCVLAMLVPPYFQNARFQRFLDNEVLRPVPPQMLKTDIVNRAAQMGLPLVEGDIRITPAQGNGLKVDIVYINRVDLKLYTVDLHFHPSAER